MNNSGVAINTDQRTSTISLASELGPVNKLGSSAIWNASTKL
jgi:hypothetical protein